MDRYTKFVLTVIAVCLVWLSLGGPSVLPVVDAQIPPRPTEVVIVGWRDALGEVWKFPATQALRPDASLSSFERDRVERERSAGARLPVSVPPF